jgi:large repetitive protein
VFARRVTWRLRFLIWGADVMGSNRRETGRSKINGDQAKQRGQGLCVAVQDNLRVFARFLFVMLIAALSVTGASIRFASASTFTTTVPGTAITIPATYPQAGGVVIVLEGVNGNVYYQFVNPSTMFQGYQNTGAPAAWQGNPFQIGPVMALNCGPITSCSTYLGGGATRMSVRFTAYDGDSQAGMFDFNDLNLRINGQNFGANNGNWTSVPTQNTDVTGTTVISNNTGFGNNTFDTGWFQSTNPAIISSVLTTGNITATVIDADPNDNFWDFRRGNDAVTSVVPLNVAPGVTIDKASTTTAFTAVNQVIPYTFTIRNIGSVWINNVQVSDPKITGVSCPAPPAAVTANLDPGEQIVCTGNYTVRQADIDANVINNTATATGVPQAGALGPVTDTNSIPGPNAAPGFNFTKTATPAATFGGVGSLVTYSFAVENTGKLTLSNAVVTDPLLPGLSCTIPTIAPGATVNATCSGNTLTVTQAHVDAGTIANTARVALKTPAGATLTKDAGVTLNGPTQLRSLTVEKQSPTQNFNAAIRFLTPI